MEDEMSESGGYFVRFDLQLDDVETPIYNGYSRAQLQSAFDRVRPAGSWKNPIEAYFPQLSAEDFKAIDAALVFFCGCHASMVNTSGIVKVTAPGYYLTIGA
jgi:hypothetical protein